MKKPTLRAIVVVVTVLAALLCIALCLLSVSLMDIFTGFDTPVYSIDDYDLIRLPIQDYAGVQRVYTFTLPEEMGDPGNTANSLCFFVEHQYVTVLVDDVVVYETKEPDTLHVGHSPGRYWVMCYLGAENAGKEIQVQTIPVFSGVPEPTMVLSDRYGFMSVLHLVEFPFLMLAVIALVLGLFLLLMSVLLPFEHQSRTALIYLGLLAFCTGLWKFTGMSFLSMAYTGHARNFYYVSMAAFMLIPVMAIQFMNYQSSKLPAGGGQLCALAAGLSAIVLAVLQFADVLPLYQTLPYLLTVSLLLFILYTFGFLVMRRGKDYRWLIGYPVAAIVDLCIYLSMDSSRFCVVFLLWILVHSLSQALTYTRAAIRREGELKEVRTQALMNQIRPHFIHNTLASIYYLCDTDPKEAQNVVENFMTYLQSNFAAITKSTTVPFTEELTHTKAYLAVEQTRYQDQIFVTYDTDYNAFQLPALTVQPLVENAVKYGVGKGISPEHITIRSRPVPEGSQIEIIDDGSGFDTSQPQTGTHVGIKNIRERLDIVCGGTLTVQSAPGQGTTVTVFIPDSTRGGKRRKRRGRKVSGAEETS